MREKLIELIEESTGCTYGGEYGDEVVENEIDISYSEIERIADHLIASGVVVSKMETTTDKDNNVPSKWIPVTERLPEHKDGHVLVTDGELVKISCRNSCYKTASGEMRCAQGYGSGMAVTHWMPLPPAPKGE